VGHGREPAKNFAESRQIVVDESGELAFWWRAS
jgi:hypothetical protein